MPPFAIKDEHTVYIIDPSQIRWLEYSERHGDLTLYYMNGAMEVIKHRNARKVYEDLLLQFNVLDLARY
jgi:hypothetical protein